MKSNKKPAHELPVMKAHCKTCPFRKDAKGQRAEVTNVWCNVIRLKGFIGDWTMGNFKVVGEIKKLKGLDTEHYEIN